jgi:CheY-like chemotaxis protein
VSRIVAGKFDVDMGTADPVAIVQAAIESIQPVAAAKDVVLSIDVGREAAADGGVLHGDPGRLQQAVWNLLSNAIKFTPHGGRVFVSVGHVGSSVEIVVRDTGEGISPDAIPWVFERLQQGEGGMARRHAGLGLGLAIVRQVVDLHHGTVSAESDGLGQGATFRIVLPTSIVTAPRERPAIAPLSSVRSDAFAGEHVPSVRGVHVLLVEDAADARELLNHVLARHGAVVTSVPNAEAAVRSLKWNRPDVIISDIAMPGQDGLEMMRTIRSQPALASRFIPAIALSAYGAPEDRKRSLASGFQVHLSKPIDLADLLMTLASLVETGSQQEPLAGRS